MDALTYVANIHALNDAIKNQHFVFYKEDIRNREGIDRTFETEHPDIVVNFAAESHVDKSNENLVILLGTNVIGTAAMDACRKYSIQRFHQIGTDEVYGNLPLDRPNLFFMRTLRYIPVLRILHLRRQLVFLCKPIIAPMVCL